MFIESLQVTAKHVHI